MLLLRKAHLGEVSVTVWPKIDATLELDSKAVVSVSFGGIEISLDGAKGTLRCGWVEAPLVLNEERQIRLQILVDRGSVEVFAADGRSVLAEGVLVPPGEKRLSLSAVSGDTRIVSFDLWTLNSIWPRNAAGGQ